LRREGDYKQHHEGGPGWFNPGIMRVLAPSGEGEIGPRRVREEEVVEGAGWDRFVITSSRWQGGGRVEGRKRSSNTTSWF